MSSQINRKDLATFVGSNPFRLILGLGFDQRCFNVLEVLLPALPIETIALVNVGWNEANDPALQQYTKITNGNGKLVGINSNNILELADQLSVAVDTFDPQTRIVIDITSISHELLSVLIAMLKVKNRLSGTTICYTGAAQYSYKTAPEDIWLSKGVSSIRSILGYPGEQLPSRPLHLIITVGFEVERALEVIETYEPAYLSLGVGRKEHSISDSHYQTNVKFFEKLEAFITDQEQAYSQVKKFEFSCVDPLDTKKDIENYIQNFPNLNTVICSLNTKLSTVGVALFCLEHPEIQQCYAQPIEYNTDGYATPGELVTVIQI